MARTERGGEKALRQGKRVATGSHDGNDLLHPGEVPAEEMVPGEALPVFLHDLKQLPEPAIPGLDSSSANQFVAGYNEKCNPAAKFYPIGRYQTDPTLPFYIPPPSNYVSLAICNSHVCVVVKPFFYLVKATWTLLSDTALVHGPHLFR